MEVSGSLPRTPPSTPPRYTLGIDGAWALHARPFLLLATAAWMAHSSCTCCLDSPRAPPLYH